MKKDCGPSKENEYNSTHIVESMLEEKVNQRDNIEPSSLSEAYSNVSILSIKHQCLILLDIYQFKCLFLKTVSSFHYLCKIRIISAN